MNKNLIDSQIKNAKPAKRQLQMEHSQECNYTTIECRNPGCGEQVLLGKLKFHIKQEYLCVCKEANSHLTDHLTLKLHSTPNLYAIIMNYRIMNCILATSYKNLVLKIISQAIPY